MPEALGVHKLVSSSFVPHLHEKEELFPVERCPVPSGQILSRGAGRVGVKAWGWGAA